MATSSTTRLSAASGWKLTPTDTPRAGRRGAAAESGLLAALAATGRVALDSQYLAKRPARRGAADEPLVLELWNGFDNINFLLERSKPYVALGRSQSEDQARAIDATVGALLARLQVPFERAVADEQAPARIAESLQRRG